MAKITKFDRPTCKIVHDMAVEQLLAAAATLGLDVRGKGGSYVEGRFT